MRPIQISAAVSAILLFLLLDCLTFRTGFYGHFVEPDSGAGMFKLRLEQANYLTSRRQHLIAFVGDSRMAEGFSAKIFDDYASTRGPYTAINLAMPGASLRVCYYLLQQVDKNNKSFDAIVFALPSYTLRDMDDFDLEDRLLDLNFLLPMGRSRQLFDALNTCNSFEMKANIIAGVLCRCWAYRQDLRAFLANPRLRIKRVAQLFHPQVRDDYCYEGSPRTLSGLTYGSESILGMPPDTPEDVRSRLRLNFERGVHPQYKYQLPFVRYWLNRIVSKYKNSGTKIILVRVPSELFRPELELAPPDSVITDFEAVPKVTVLEQTTFANLEKPQFFADDLHVNQEGRKLFSEKISEEVMRVMSSSF